MTKQLEVNPKTKILIKARDILERGWCQGAGRRNSAEGYQHCITGSIWHAVGGFSITDPYQGELLRQVVETMYAIIGKVLPRYTRPVDIVEWNDWPTRTKEEVLELMNQAIAISISDGMHARSEAT